MTNLETLIAIISLRSKYFWYHRARLFLFSRGHKTKLVNKTMFKSDKSKKPATSQTTTCLCQMLSVTLFWTRLFGLSPISWIRAKKSETEIPHKCLFVVSTTWQIYSAFLIFIYSLVYFQYASIGFKTDNLSQLLIDINHVVYLTFGFVLTLWGMRNAGRLVETLTQVAVYVHDGWLCDNSKAHVRATVWQGIVAVMLQLSFQFGAQFFINYHDAFEQNSNPYDLGGYIIHNVPFMFYYLFCTVCSILMALFRCFDTKLSGVLRAQVPHHRQHCTGPHEFIGQSVSRSAQIDQLRRIHEQIRTSMMDLNAAMNPQILIHQFIELLVIVMHLYSIIMFFGMPAETPKLYATFFLDCLFVVVHVCALVIFFSSADRIKTRVSRVDRNI
jgi:hypothetical protein